MIKSSSSSSFLQSLTIVLIFCSSFAVTVLVSAHVSPSKVFSYDLKPDSFIVGGGDTEYHVWYRALPFQSFPFTLYFYQDTAESRRNNGFNDEPAFVTRSYILAIGMGVISKPITRWVWEANLHHPVGRNAKLIFSRSGNLALTDGDGRIAWQTKTSNKGVADIKLLRNGNLVLIDRNGGFVWQSFYHPTNALLIGQGLGPGSSSTNKIVNGKYSMVLQDKALRLFFNPNPKSASSKPFSYFKVSPVTDLDVNITFSTIVDPDYFDQLLFLTGSGGIPFFGLSSPQFNSTLSMLRLSSIGNLHIYTYIDLPGKGSDVWVETYAAFSREEPSECYLPQMCGSFGLCKDHQCVACPTPKGLFGWDEKCTLPDIPSCNASTAVNVGYFQVENVEDYRPVGESDGEGPITLEECKKKCSNDCKCVGFFYRYDEQMCTLAAQLNTLAKRSVFLRSVDAYVKYVM